MPAPGQVSRDIIKRLLGGGAPEEALARLAPRPPAVDPLPPRMPRGNDRSREAVARRREILEERSAALPRLTAALESQSPCDLSGNIENLIGFAALPVGVAGPLRINGMYAHGDYYLPLATSEGALVASCSRGACVVSQSGGASAACLTECVMRAPCFLFDHMRDAGVFIAWLLEQVDDLKSAVEAGSRHCRLLDLSTTFAGKEVYVLFEYSTGDAAGQNMVTLATDLLCRKIVEEAPVRPVRWYVESNLSGDKKATMLGFLSTRGRKVVAEAELAGDLVERYLHVTPEEMVRYWQISVMGGAQSGSIGVQGHYANALAALYIACGQDAACVSESAVGMTRMDLTPGGALYVSVSLPGLIVGTVGGGTRLPTAAECLRMLDCEGEGKARAFAEICAAAALAGEVSIIAALAAGQFADAHARYGRKHPTAS